MESWFRQPEGLDQSIDSLRSAGDLAALLRGAAAQGRQSSRVDGSPYVVRLGGTVRGSTVDLEARILRADGRFGRPKLPLRAIGSIRSRATGSTLDVRIAADDRRTAAWVVGIPVAAIGLMLVAGLPPIVAVLMGGLAALNFLLAIRVGQRFVLRSASQFEVLLETIARGG